MTTYLGKSCSFGLPRVPFVNCGQFMYLVISRFGFEGRMWDLIVSVPDHCLSFYFSTQVNLKSCTSLGQEIQLNTPICFTAKSFKRWIMPNTSDLKSAMIYVGRRISKM